MQNNIIILVVNLTVRIFSPSLSCHSVVDPEVSLSISSWRGASSFLSISSNSWMK